jgi:hypothetical protein
MAIAKDLVQQPGSQRLARVHGHHGAPAIFVTKEMMAPFDANDLETVLHQGGDQFGAGDPWAPTHAAMVMR